MIGTTLGDIRSHIESLATDEGRYYLVCGRTRDRPVPADELYFDSREVARLAARATEQYRATLRRYDPRLPYYDVIICEELPDAPSPDDAQKLSTEPDPVGSSRKRSLTDPDRATSVIDFCHTITAVIFETIARSTHFGLENTIMETYLAEAETVDDPDELCFRLLESIATQLDDQLDPHEQATLLRSAAATLPEEYCPTGKNPIDGVLTKLESAHLLDMYRIDHSPSVLPRDARQWDVQLCGYPLGSGTQIVTLPLNLALYERLPSDAPTITSAERIDTAAPPTWRLTVATTTTTTPSQGLVCTQER